MKFTPIVQLSKETGLSTVTIWRAINAGRIKAFMTPGGHRRITTDEADRVKRDMGFNVKKRKR